MMKKALVAVVAALFASEYLPAQDPSFRPAEQPAGSRRQTAAAAAPTESAPAPARDDSAVAASRIMSMQSLDDVRPLMIGDRISLKIVEDPEKVLSLDVQDSGDIQAPYIGLVKASGRTCKQVAVSMKSKLEEQYFQRATVIIALEKAVRSKFGPNMVPDDMGYVTIYGQVGRQGKYELAPEEELTVSQAILRAGGFTQFAKTKKVKVIRKRPGQNSITYEINLHDVMTKGRLEKDILIRPNDVIIVDEKLINF
ncbi:polysaccharide biosynthesis/export family protein [Verrucomicrobium sp. BvORR106]|uniref:polysaccharide biosynthesis/export family protein n=1 Tax=Verrucomicrobium sp. BvORR106 TaxID=1403819 RepID=UPI00056FFAFD|nr:polysaccharide biosynthesis/export family protein [Verrucomicrobium sp. BvORR106]